MPDVVGVRFKPSGKIYSFEVNGISAKPGIWIVVESEMGLNLGLIVRSRHHMEKPGQKLKKILRIATVQDLEADRNNRNLENEAGTFCTNRAKRLNLPMKIVNTESTLDRKRLIFYFTADGRIDFRELVRDLASKFKTRIEMRQIGVRDEVKCTGGIGCCGREVCCKLFLTSFEPISIRMAKKQELALNPGKLSGICGRLMCCLGYEIDQSHKKSPRKKAATGKGKDKPVSKSEKSPADKTGIETAVTAVEVRTETATESSKTQSSQTTDKKTEQAGQAGQAPLPVRKATPSQKEKNVGDRQKADKTRKNNRGKPFNKRKKFWRKKK